MVVSPGRWSAMSTPLGLGKRETRHRLITTGSSLFRKVGVAKVWVGYPIDSTMIAKAWLNNSNEASGKHDTQGPITTWVVKHV